MHQSTAARAPRRHSVNLDGIVAQPIPEPAPAPPVRARRGSGGDDGGGGHPAPPPGGSGPRAASRRLSDAEPPAAGTGARRAAKANGGKAGDGGGSSSSDDGAGPSPPKRAAGGGPPGRQPPGGSPDLTPSGLKAEAMRRYTERRRAEIKAKSEKTNQVDPMTTRSNGFMCKLRKGRKGGREGVRLWGAEWCVCVGGRGGTPYPFC